MSVKIVDVVVEPYEGHPTGQPGCVTGCGRAMLEGEGYGFVGLDGDGERYPLCYLCGRCTVRLETAHHNRPVLPPCATAGCALGARFKVFWPTATGGPAVSPNPLELCPRHTESIRAVAETLGFLLVILPDPDEPLP